ncbi:hypothetical protein [Marivita sp. S2033]|uniref:hypothetical protein n=1 Tax=Marivita sp. S2033 TaxID=3373187 RepID=UPI003982643E
MIRAGLVACLASAAVPAWSLSCSAPDIARDYQRASKSAESYIVVMGDLSFDESGLPETDWQNQRQTSPITDIDGRLSGHSLTRDGFTHHFDRDITLRVTCLGPWCGGVSEGLHLTFLKQDGASLVMEVGPCPGWTYPNPSQETVERVISCLRGGTCEDRQ